jgi:hypothetical protein
MKDDATITATINRKSRSGDNRESRTTTRMPKYNDLGSEDTLESSTTTHTPKYNELSGVRGHS